MGRDGDEMGRRGPMMVLAYAGRRKCVPFTSLSEYGVWTGYDDRYVGMICVMCVIDGR